MEQFCDECKPTFEKYKKNKMDLQDPVFLEKVIKLLQEKIRNFQNTKVNTEGEN